jgi:hypothetical protein
VDVSKLDSSVLALRSSSSDGSNRLELAIWVVIVVGDLEECGASECGSSKELTLTSFESKSEGAKRVERTMGVTMQMQGKEGGREGEGGDE